jgi:hypothetical protein
MRTIGLAAALIAASLGTACSHPPSPTPQIVTLIDRSGSANGQAVAGRDVDAFTQLAAYAARSGGFVAAETIEANPLQHSATPVAVDFQLPKAVRDNPVYASPLRARRREVAMTAMRRLLRQPADSRGSDILSAIQVAARFFAEGRRHSPQMLTICSDMIQSSAQYNFYDQPLDEGSIDCLVAQLRAEGQIPNLHDVVVYAVGVGEDAVNEIAPERNRQIERFWRTYFTAAGAQLASYAATLQAFPPDVAA